MADPTIGGSTGGTQPSLTTIPPTTDTITVKEPISNGNVDGTQYLTIIKQIESDPDYQKLLAAGSDHGDLETPTIDLDDSYMEGITIKLIAKYGNISEDQAKSVISRLNSISDDITQKNHERMENISDQLKTMAKSTALDPLTTGLAIGGLVLAAIVTGASLGTASPAAAALSVASVALLATNFALSETHVYDQMDPDGAKALEYSMLITGMVCGMGAGGVGALSSLTSSATTTSTAVGEAALEGGTAAAQAGTAAEAADAIVEGTYDGALALEAADDATLTTDATVEAGSDVVGTVDDDVAAVAGSDEEVDLASSEGGLEVGGDEPEAVAEPQSDPADDVDVEDYDVDDVPEDEEVTGSEGEETAPEDNDVNADDDQKAAIKQYTKAVTRGGRVLEASDKIGSQAVNMQKALYDKELSDLRAKNTKISTQTQYMEAVEKDKSEQLGEIAKKNSKIQQIGVQAIASFGETQEVLADTLSYDQYG